MYQEQVFTVAEVARTLKISGETVRRKIAAGELEALEVSIKPRKQYRILYSDLTRWLGLERAGRLFGVGEGLKAVEAAFATLPPQQRERLLEWSRNHAPKVKPTGRVLDEKTVQERLGR